MYDAQHPRQLFFTLRIISAAEIIRSDSHRVEGRPRSRSITSARGTAKRENRSRVGQQLLLLVRASLLSTSVTSVLRGTRAYLCHLSAHVDLGDLRRGVRTRIFLDS